MLKVYQEKSTGDHYTLPKGDFLTTINEQGQWVLLLEPAYQVTNKMTGEIHPGGKFDGMANEKTGRYAHTRVVPYKAFKENFELSFIYGAPRNMPIEKLIAEYKNECSDIADLNWVVQTSRFYVNRMEDGQARLLLHALAEELARVRNLPSLEEAMPGSDSV